MNKCFIPTIQHKPASGNPTPRRWINKRNRDVTPRSRRSPDQDGPQNGAGIETDHHAGAMSIYKFCDWAGIGRTSAYAEIKAGRLRVRKMGARTIVEVSEAQRWLASLPRMESK
jgi:hypothetical protein